ncbi:MAG: hypothetical protein KDK23_06925 [Leptospiraceae bacterium]|nr:hypothetical protein [Leptospiraceae bacterium]MCB1167882.1 hypothetical protein [Leptospiraceae bacterium]
MIVQLGRDAVLFIGYIEMLRMVLSRGEKVIEHGDGLRIGLEMINLQCFTFFRPFSGIKGTDQSHSS